MLRKDTRHDGVATSLLMLISPIKSVGHVADILKIDPKPTHKLNNSSTLSFICLLLTDLAGFI